MFLIVNINVNVKNIIGYTVFFINIKLFRYVENIIYYEIIKNHFKK